MRKIKQASLKVGDIVSVAFLDHCRLDRVSKGAATNTLCVLEDFGEVSAIHNDRIVICHTQELDPTSLTYKAGDDADTVGVIIRSCILRVKLWSRNE